MCFTRQARDRWDWTLCVIQRDPTDFDDLDSRNHGTLEAAVANANRQLRALLPRAAVEDLLAAVEKRTTAFVDEHRVDGRWVDWEMEMVHDELQHVVTALRKLLHKDAPAPTTTPEAATTTIPEASSRDRCGPNCRCGMDRGCPAFRTTAPEAKDSAPTTEGFISSAELQRRYK